MENINVKFETLSADTVCMLFSGKTGPKCELNYSIRYADEESPELSYINKLIIQGLFPEKDTASFNIDKAVAERMSSIISEYKDNLSGVTKKALSEGNYPLGFADYKQTTSTETEIIKNKIVVYHISYSEQAYGATNIVENEKYLNINLKDKSLVTLDDIFVPGYKERLADKIVNKIAAKYNVTGLSGLQYAGVFSEGIPYAPDNFVIGDDNVEFVYNPCEIASCKHGIIRADIPVSELKDIMEKGWYSFFESK